MKELPIFELIELLPADAVKICKNIINDNLDLFLEAPGSSHNHQAWKGGYLDHITETMRIGITLYESLNDVRALPFTMADMLLVLFLHDIEKPWLYSKPQRSWDKKYREKFRLSLAYDSGLNLSPKTIEALKTVEGEGDLYSSGKRIMTELGAVCHCADVLSARLWYDYPQDSDDWAIKND